MRYAIIGLLLVSGVMGCDVNVTVDGPAGQEAPVAPVPPATGANSGDGFSLQIPSLGVDVQGKEGNWDVTAPGTDVRLKDGKVDVQAPGTNVRYGDGKVDVQAPGTSVEVK